MVVPVLQRIAFAPLLVQAHVLWAEHALSGPQYCEIRTIYQ
jgi:hypothetical protein